MDSTLNVRMDASLKARGDKVLRKNGISTSYAVRALWRELANTRELPPFLMEASADYGDRKRKAAALNALVGVAQGRLSDLSDDELRAVGAARYE